MSSNESQVLVLFFWALRHYLGKKVNLAQHHAFLQWLATNGWPHECAICGGYVTAGQRSLDHIIPISVCNEIDLPGLRLDPRNFRLAHKECNWKRSSNTSDLPEAVLEKIASLQAAQLSA